MKLNIKNRGAVSLAVTLFGSLIGLSLLTVAALNNNGLSSINNKNLLAQVDAYTPLITVLSPNGGEMYALNTVIPVDWKMNYDSGATSIDVYLYSPTIGNVFKSYSLIGMVGSNRWTIPLNAADSAGQYKVTICDETKDNPNSPGKPLCDSSDNNFTITSPKPTCTPSTSCVSQYCQSGGDLKNCTVTNADCSTSSYTTGSCNSAPPPPPPPGTLTCDATAKAILNAVGGCSQLNSSQYPNVYKACCTLVTKETLLGLLDKALQDGRIDEQEKADLLRALDSYLSTLRG